MSLSSLDDDTALLRVRLAERERELSALREAATDAAEAAAGRLRAAREEAVALRTALEEALVPTPAESLVEAPAEVPVAEVVPLATIPAAPVHRSLRRTLALPLWRLVRPVARPVLWRARTFFMADAVRELAVLRASQEAMQQAVREAVQEALGCAASPPACTGETLRGGPSHGLGLGDTAAERWLLTVALESSQPA